MKAKKLHGLKAKLYNKKRHSEKIQMKKAIKMHEGDSLPGFPSPDTFEFLILPHLRKIQEPSMECLNEVSQILEQLCSKIAKVVFRRFPRLGEVVLDMTKGILQREQQTTSKVVENIVHYETGYLFTNDDGYLGSHGSMSSMYQQRSDNVAPPPPAPQAGDGVNAFSAPPPPPPAQHGGPTTFVREVRGRLNAYFKLVIRNTRDGVPKAIGFFLVRKMQDTLQFELYNQLTSADRMSELLGEPPHIVEERRSLSAELKILRPKRCAFSKNSGLLVKEYADSNPPNPRIVISIVCTSSDQSGISSFCLTKESASENSSCNPMRYRVSKDSKMLTPILAQLPCPPESGRTSSAPSGASSQRTSGH